jgi:predicted nucleic acid-binding protein
VIIGVDACSVINLCNSGVLEIVLKLPHEFLMGPEVVEECEPFEAVLDAAVSTGSIRLVPESVVSVAEVIRVAAHGLGDGETETIALGITHGWAVCSDDRRARDVARAAVGTERVIGSIGLLSQCVAARLLSSKDAYAAYEAMVAAGGFLPKLPANYFAPAVATSAAVPTEDE